MFGVSVCRNPKLAGIFYRLHLVEAYGTGIPKIFRAYQGTGKTPELKITDNVFKLVLPNANYRAEERGTESPLKNRNHEMIMQYLKGNGYITRKQAESLLGLSQSTAMRVIKQMVETGLLEQEGEGKNTLYRKK